MKIFKRLRHALINKARTGQTAPRPDTDMSPLEEWAMRFIKDAVEEGAAPADGVVVLAVAKSDDTGYVLRIRNTLLSETRFVSEATTIAISEEDAANLRRLSL